MKTRVGLCPDISLECLLHEYGDWGRIARLLLAGFNHRMMGL